MSIVRARRAPPRRRRRAATPSRSSPRRCPASAPSSAATCWRPAPPPAARATRRCTSPAAARSRSSSAAPSTLHIDGAAARAARGRHRDLRRRPAPPLREPRTRRGRPAGGRQRGPAPQSKETTHDAQDPVRQDLGGPRGRRRTCIYIDLHLVHEVTSPQAFDGLRLAGRPVRRPDRTLATADHNVPTDGTPIAARIKDELSPHAGRDARAQLRGVRHPGLLARLRAPGHRPRDRARARRHPARHDDRLRRQPHRHPRRVRRAGLRHRHQRGRARPRHAVPRRSTSPSRCGSATRASSATASPPRT